MKNKKKQKKSLFEGIRKPTAPAKSVFKTRKGENPRKAKHKGKIDPVVDRSE